MLHALNMPIISDHTYAVHLSRTLERLVVMTGYGSWDWIVLNGKGTLNIPNITLRLHIAW